MKNTILSTAWLLLLFCSCTKENLTQNLSTGRFKQFTIPQGEHYATDNSIRAIETSELKFVAKFDSSAIYLAKDPQNQYDINKLYGFSDNGEQHHLYSARFGWRWSEGALHLFAYTYNNGVREDKELGTVALNSEINCSIKVEGEQYVFSLNGQNTIMPRFSSTPSAKGYQLYPYFGGDETAPHEVRIWIKEIN